MFSNISEQHNYHDSENSITLLSNNCGEQNILPLENCVGLNVGMSGDTSDSNDADENSSSELDKPYGLVGLQNVGNTCYMNAALQALSNTLPLTRFFLECSTTVVILSEGRKPGLSRTYQGLVKDIWLKKKYGYVNPSGILYGIRNVHAMFRGYHQHDTQEFLRNFMDQLHEELKQVCPTELYNDIDSYNVTIDESGLNSSFESSDGEYETCDSGVSERSSLSDETERSATITKRKISRSTSPGHRIIPHYQNNVIDSQPQSSSSHLNNPKKQIKYRSIISDIFDGKLLSSVQCLTCSRISSRVETFQDLSLPIPSRDHVAVLHGRNIETSNVTCSEVVLPDQNGWILWLLMWLRSWFYGPTVSLHDCLGAFFSTDELKGDNMYSCEKCNKLRNGIKFSKVLQLPEILCIHLKRFRHELMFSSKISSFVSFPLRGLDVRPYLHTDCISNVTTYELFSVICHHGTAGGGHYTCYSLNGNQWYEFDDQYVTKVSPETVQASEAYVLFYRKNTSEAQVIKARASELAEMCEESVEDMVYVSKQWLSRFKTCAEPGPIDNSDFLCHHGYVDPDRVPILYQLAFGLPRQVYTYLHKKFGGCPPITNAHICSNCQQMRRRINAELEMFLNLNRDFINLRLPSTHLLSSAWFDQWQNFVQKCSYDPPGPIDNAVILAGGTNNCIEINQEIWSFFHNIYGGGPEMSLFQNKIICQSDSGDTNICNSDQVSSSVNSSEPISKNITNHQTELHSEEGNHELNEIKNSNCDPMLGIYSNAAHQNLSLPNNINSHLHRNCSSESSASATDDETANQEDVNSLENKMNAKAGKEKLYYKTKRRRFRCKISYKNKLQNSNSKNLKRKDVC